ncbi:MAG TPA: methyltransferase domain-containing protein [Acidobacteriaceae bacterium]|nr:methyltransferase domain-containing protein [Acidobacteriaceae bacterium]
MDYDHWSPEEVACALAAIRRVNLLYGGNRMHKRLFQRVAERISSKKLDVLEVASGYADVLQAASIMLQKKGFLLHISLLDRCALHLPGTGDWDPSLPKPDLLIGDAMNLPLADNSVDVVSCCLFLHHLSTDQARMFFKEALRVSRVAVLVNDVERQRTNYVLSRLQALIDPSRISRHDGPTSVRQSYTWAELKNLLRETGREYSLQRGFLYRLGATIWK